MFTADVAVEDHDEIAQDSTYMLAHSQGTFCGVVHFQINTTAPKFGLSRVPKNDINFVTYFKYHMVPYACFLLHEPEKNNIRLVLVPARTAVK